MIRLMRVKQTLDKAMGYAYDDLTGHDAPKNKGNET
jgi:hypothetical protein